jgi:hypothetical protein
MVFFYVYMTGERAISETYKAALAEVKDAGKRALQGTMSDICDVPSCPNVVSLLDDGSVIPTAGYRMYSDGSGNLPLGCDDQPDCLAKKLLQ